jgi:hypothetical protein
MCLCSVNLLYFCCTNTIRPYHRSPGVLFYSGSTCGCDIEAITRERALRTAPDVDEHEIRVIATFAIVSVVTRTTICPPSGLICESNHPTML